jgi:YbbR domain-containing protein
VRMPPGTDNTDVADFRPSTVRLSFDQVSTRLLPVAVQLTGSPAPGYELAGRPEVDPPAVRASGAGRNLARIDSLRLAPIDLGDLRGEDTLQLTIDTTGTGLIISPRNVRVLIPVRPILVDIGAPRTGG